ncbi:hypothetical protein TNIN_319981 [Trichonephila inaurata madagascariensis]|uniref:Uncharacterized protein n=1 Tax=Trichonephila inaurata madagascariensis TaxID=2747483 RepID=A0A8X7BXV9_9ARAC|nr:hypothetical protein TNIN_319981 [Trichonephila inaurata madagascariensis]
MFTFFDDSLESLLAALNNVTNSTKKDSTVGDVLKIIPITENSQFEFGDSADCSVILDASMVSAAFKFYKSRMFTNASSFERLDACNDMWKNSCALIKTTDSPISRNISTDVERSPPMPVNETRNLVSSWPDLYDLFEEEAQKVDNIKCDEDILIIDPMDALDDELNNTSPLHLNLIDYHNLGNSTKADNEVWRKTVDSRFQNYSAKIEKQNLISVPKDSVEENSSTNFEEQNSTNSLKFYENYFCEELDYEPSENGEIVEPVNEDESYAESFVEVEEYESFSDYFLEDEISENDSVDDNQSTDRTNTEFLNTLSGVDEKLCGLRRESKRSIESLEDDTDEDKDYSFKRYIFQN